MNFLLQSVLDIQTDRMGGNIVSKYEYGNARPISGWTCAHCNYKTDYIHKLEEHQERSHAADTMQEDEYVEAMFHCTQCDYKTNNSFQLSAHMEISHTQDEVLAESKIEEEMVNAIEVWKIYKLLRRMKNK